jgi:threonine dehydratase
MCSGRLRLRPTLADIEQARDRLDGVARVTPVFTSETIGRMVGRPVLLKAENLQRTGAFKIRGAFATIAQLSAAERKAGVVTASAGNHGQAVAWAAGRAGITATIVVPNFAPMAKVEAARGYGAEVLLEGEGYDECVDRARAFESETGATFVHAFDDPRVIAGQGTLGLELAEQLPAGPGTIVIPVGGGGLASGIAIALSALRPELRLVGVQAANCAPLAGLAPRGTTIADGIAVKQPGALTEPILRELLDDIVVAEDDEISQAIVLLLERAKLVVEGAGAAPLAALLADRVGDGDSPVCVVLAGGNVDATTLNSVIRYGLTASGRHLVLRLLISDRPGELARIVGIIADERANILAIAHHREGRNIGVLETEAELTLETRGEEHSQRVIHALATGGFVVERS